MPGPEMHHGTIRKNICYQAIALLVKYSCLDSFDLSGGRQFVLTPDISCLGSVCQVWVKG